MVHGVMSGEAVVKEQGFKSVFFPKKIAPEVQAMLEGDWVSSGEGFMAWWRLADQSREFWVETPSELTRVHVTPRKHLFVPSRWSTQHSALKQNLLETLGGTRTTDFLPCLCDGVVLQQRTDQWKLPCEELSCGLWVGRSRFSKEGTNLQARSLPPPGATFHGRALALGMEDGEERHLGRAPLLRGAVPRHLAAAGAEDHLAGAAASTSAPGRGGRYEGHQQDDAGRADHQVPGEQDQHALQPTRGALIALLRSSTQGSGSRVLPFGKFNGWMCREVPPGYRQWAQEEVAANPNHSPDLAAFAS